MKSFPCDVAGSVGSPLHPRRSVIGVGLAVLAFPRSRSNMLRKTIIVSGRLGGRAGEILAIVPIGDGGSYGEPGQGAPRCSSSGSFR